MAVKFMKKEVETQQTPVPEVAKPKLPLASPKSPIGMSATKETMMAEMQALVDELGSTSADMEVATAKLAKNPTYKEVQQLGTRVNELTTKIKEIGEQYAKEDEKINVYGSKFIATLGEKAKQSKLLEGWKAKLKKMIGPEAYDSIVSVAIGDIRKYVPETKIGEILDEKKTGARSFKIAPRK